MVKRQLIMVATFLLALAASASNVAAQTQEKVHGETIDRVVKLLEGSGYRYSKLTQSAWLVSFKGKSKEAVDVVVTPDRDDLVFLSVIADRAQLDNNVVALRQLLKANGALPEGVSIMVDDDDDYIVATRSPLKQLNVTRFKEAFATVANATDNVFGSALKASPGPLSKPSATTLGRTVVAPTSATREIELLGGSAAVSIDPNMWKDAKPEAGKLNFQHRRGDGYAMIISERIQIPFERLKQIALDNAREAAPGVTIVEEEWRRVNGTDVLLLRMEGELQGIAFTYFGYYYGGAAGTVQVITYTGRNLFPEYRRDFEEFLNGFHLK